MGASSSRPPPPPEPAPDRPTDLATARALYAQLDPAWFDEANDPEAWLFEPAVQQLIAEVVDAEVAPFAKLLSPDELRALRDELELACHTDPTAIEYLKRIRPRPEQNRSGKAKKSLLQGGALLPLVKKAGGERP